MHTASTVQETHHWHQVLGVACNATFEEINLAYKKQAVSWHAGCRSGSHAFANKRITEITNAYYCLSHRGPPSHKLHETVVRQGFEANVLHSRPPFPKRRSSGSSLRRELSVSSSSSDSESESGSEESTSPSTPPSSLHSSFDHNHSLAVQVRMNKAASSTQSYSGQNQEEASDYFSGSHNKHYDSLRDTSRSRDRFSKGSSRSKHPKREPPPLSMPPHSVPIHPSSIGGPKEWHYNMSVALEDLFHGKRCRFRITRCLLSGATKSAIVNVQIPPGAHAGTRVICAGVGHEKKDGTFQDVVIVIDQAPHNRFIRVGNDLIMDVQIPSTHADESDCGKLSFTSIDGEALLAGVEIKGPHTTKGSSVVIGAGMPIVRDKVVIGRGNVIVRWEIMSSAKNTWRNVKSYLQLRNKDNDMSY